jgi:hypothetical protein
MDFYYGLVAGINASLSDKCTIHVFNGKNYNIGYETTYSYLESNNFSKLELLQILYTIHGELTTGLVSAEPVDSLSDMENYSLDARIKCVNAFLRHVRLVIGILKN